MHVQVLSDDLEKISIIVFHSKLQEPTFKADFNLDEPFRPLEKTESHKGSTLFFLECRK